MGESINQVLGDLCWQYLPTKLLRFSYAKIGHMPVEKYELAHLFSGTF